MTLNVTFFTKARENKRLSREAGRPIFEDVEMVKVAVPGERLTTVVAPAHEPHRIGGGVTTYAKRFADVYAQFKADAAQTVSGTPLSEAPFLTEAKRAELRAVNIHVIEQLASLGEGEAKRVGVGGGKIIAEAKAYLHRADATVAEREKQEMREAMEAMRAELEALKAKKDEPEAKEFDSFDEMTDDELKAFIKEQTGQAPQGQPSRKTLLKRAAEAHQGVDAG